MKPLEEEVGEAAAAALAAGRPELVDQLIEGLYAWGRDVQSPRVDDDAKGRPE